MELEEISKREEFVKEKVMEWNNNLEENSEKYLRRNEIAMDAKMYLALNQLYLKKKRENNLN